MNYHDKDTDGVKLMIMKWCICDDDHEVSQINDDDEELDCDVD